MTNVEWDGDSPPPDWPTDNLAAALGQLLILYPNVERVMFQLSGDPRVFEMARKGETAQKTETVNYAPGGYL